MTKWTSATFGVAGPITWEQNNHSLALVSLSGFDSRSWRNTVRQNRTLEVNLKGKPATAVALGSSITLLDSDNKVMRASRGKEAVSYAHMIAHVERVNLGEG